MTTDARPTGRDAGRLRAAVAALVRRFAVSERADVSCCGVTVAQAAALEALAEGPLRLSDLGRRLGIAPSTLTRNLSRLESSGLVARASDPDDARSARVGLTPAGRRAARGVVAREEEFARDVLDRLPSGFGRPVVEALEALVAAVRAATEDCCPGAFDHLMTSAAEGTDRESDAAGREGECQCGPGGRGAIRRREGA
jgi:DNA-binding MarR family transcriptional regulator